MRKTVKYPFFGLILFLFILVNLPKEISDRIRLAAASPFGKRSLQLHTDEISQLRLENQNLRAQIDRVYEWVMYDRRIAESVEFLKGNKEFSQRRALHLSELLGSYLASIPGQVTYRDPSSWSSSLWVNVGEENNLALGKKVVAKNSPVLAEGALVGVIEYVGRKQSRVRLITDSGLCPSVRVHRGSFQNRELLHQLNALSQQIEKREGLFISPEEKESFLFQIEKLKKVCGSLVEDRYLAKGELRGSSAPFWRSRSPILKGIGFNFDSPDEEVHQDTPILKEGDLLVTSGLDGVFPPNLQVGIVSKIDPLKEGSYAYDIEVRSVATHLNDLETLFILPPLE